jgi:hypothetical protein
MEQDNNNKNNKDKGVYNYESLFYINHIEETQ